MKKKLAILIPVILAVLAIAAGVIAYIRMLPKDVAETGNKANVEWYSEDAEEFTITTVAEFYEFMELSSFYDFKDQTVKLGADLVMNEGDAAEWGKKAPENKWYPIRGFAGTFDGQGHSISGVYGVGMDITMGLFAETQPNCVIKDFKLLNSYFEAEGNYSIGSISGSGSGKFSNIYSDAIVVSNGTNAGGLIGEINSGGKSSVMAFLHSISNCWFDGSVTLVDELDGMRAAGLVAAVSNGTLVVEHCLNSGTVTGPNNHVGGLIGMATNKSGAIININDCFNSGKVEYGGEKYNFANGSILARLGDKTSATVSNTAATLESHHSTLGSSTSATGYVVQKQEKSLIGYGGYQWTQLDFDNYWAVQMNSTPILKYFAEEVPSLDGVKKAFDTSWYDETKKEYLIDSVEDFWGLQMISQGMSFEGKIIKLGTDITINTGKASDWAKEAPEHSIAPLGTFSIPFKGTLDGQGHTISGVYVKKDTPGAGLFAATHECTIKNLKLTNSYFESTTTKDNAAITGSIAGRFGGTLEKVYSDAIVVAESGYLGGLVGQWSGGGSMSECWFDGSVTSTGKNSVFIGGLAGIVQNPLSYKVEHCLNTGTITGQGTKVGGLLGVIVNKGLKISVNDCFNAGVVAPSGNYHVGSAIGAITGEVEASVMRTSTTTESSKTAYTVAENTLFVGAINQKSEELLSGTGGYVWTELDFKNYWSIVKDSTPVLKCFAKSSPSVAGLERKIDTSWYSGDKDTYYIDSVADLNGFAEMTKNYDFAGKTIVLKKDITYNTGDANQWGNKAPENAWTPMGSFGKSFAGTLDGQGHTISGLYVKQDTPGAGLFAAVHKGTIKNLKLTNSYFESTTTKDNAAITGSIAGRFGGTLEKVYSDAIVVSGSGYLGGLVGQWSGGGTMSECWFDGSVTSTEKNSVYIGGLAGIVQNPLEYKMAHCLNTGDISGQGTKVGGLAGVVVNKGLKFTMEDCLNAGQVSPSGNYHVGSVVGGILDDVEATVMTTSATLESSKLAYTTSEKADFSGWVIQKSEAVLGGNGGYEWTELDFKNYWSIVKDSTPILKCFAQSSPSISGLDRQINTGWYNEEKDTYYIDSTADFNGFAVLTETNDFAGKTIVLRTDVVLNIGDASKWGTTTPANIWKPMSSFAKPFAGTLDGNGHTISGLYVKQDSYGAGLFTATNKCTIKDLKLTNSYVESTATKDNTAIAGSIAGRFGGTLEKVYSDAIVVTKGSCTGGFIGQWSGGGTMSECWFDGSVTVKGASSIYVSGLAGILQNPVDYKIVHCLNTADVSAEAGYVGGFAGVVANTGLTLQMEDCLNVGIITSTKSDNVASVIGGSIASPAITFETITTAKESHKVAATQTAVMKTAGYIVQIELEKLKGNGGYEWTELDFKDYWAIVSGSTPILQHFADEVPSVDSLEKKIDTTWFDKSKDTYELEDEADLYGFAALSQTYDFSGKTIILKDDMTLNTGDASTWGTTSPANVWTPIGSFALPFAGTFDGDGHTIRGLYMKRASNGAGLFTATNKCTIKNLAIRNSYIESTTTQDNVAIAGSVAGRFGGTLEKVYSDAFVVAYGGYTGGLVGQWSGGGLMSECWFAGSVTVTGANSTNNGGLAGMLQNGLAYAIRHCLNTGTVTAKAGATGGLCGYVANTGLTLVIDDSMSTGSVTSDATAGVGAIIGNQGSGTPEITITGTCATTESHATAFTPSTLIKGYVLQKSIADLSGNGGYEWSELDFKDYWSLVSNSTPVLKHFAESSPSIDGLNRKVSTKWYKKDTDTYELETLADLIGFTYVSQIDTFKGKTVKLTADITVNEGTASVNGFTMTDGSRPDIWKPIGNMAYPFEGTFDGGNHRLIGVCGYTDSQHYLGLFQSLAGTVQNLKLMNSYFRSDYAYRDDTAAGAVSMVGAIAGLGSGTISNVYSEAIVYGSGNRAGGFVGFCNGALTITNCQNAGTVGVGTSVGQAAAGFIGAAWNQANVSIAHCLNTGTINGSSALGGFVGVVFGGTLNITDSFNSGTVKATSGSFTRSGSYLGMFYNNAVATISNCYVTTNCFYVNATAQSEMIGFASSATLNTVTQTAGDNGLYPSAANGVTEYAKDKISGIGGRIYTNLNFKEYWSAIEGRTPELTSLTTGKKLTIDDSMKLDTSWYTGNQSEYTIDSVGELYGLAELAQNNSFANVTIKLGKNITVNTGKASEWGANAYKWLPIGNTTYPFAGTFDGDGYTISGLYGYTNSEFYLGFIRKLTGTVQNLKLTNSSFKSEYKANDGTGGGNVTNVGAIAGWAGGTIQNVYSEATVYGSGNRVGGFAGYCNSTLAIINCWNKGEVTGTDTAVGGFLGAAWVNANVSFNNCLNSGNVKANYHLGGFVGQAYGNGCSVSIGDCVNTGTITANTGVKRNGSFIGVLNGSASLTVSDTYATTESTSFGAVGLVSGATVNGTSVSGNWQPAYYENTANQTNKVSGAYEVAEATLKSDAQAATSKLDWNTYWKTDSNGLPVLKQSTLK